MVFSLTLNACARLVSLLMLSVVRYALVSAARRPIAVRAPLQSPRFWQENVCAWGRCR